jgi:hypothetical protein
MGKISFVDLSSDNLEHPKASLIENYLTVKVLSNLLLLSGFSSIFDSSFVL